MTTKARTAVGEYIRKQRNRRGLALKEVASQLTKQDGQPLSVTYLSDIESGRRVPQGSLLLQIGQILEIDHDYLQYLRGTWPKRVVYQRLSYAEFKTRLKAFEEAVN